MSKITPIGNRWGADWELIVAQMYERRVKIFETISSTAGRPSVYVCGGIRVYTASIDALCARRLVTRTQNRGKGRITWSLTDKGREAAKVLIS